MAASLLTVPGRGLMQAAEPPLSEADPRQRIEAALPSQVLAPPLRPRKLLIFDRNVNYGGHASIPTANLAFTRMGQKTGAFETVVSQDPAIFKPQDLRQFHAVFFNNTVGNLFEDPALRESLAEFVYGGGGLMGVHGTSVAFTRWPGAAEDWPEFGRMLGRAGPTIVTAMNTSLSGWTTRVIRSTNRLAARASITGTNSSASRSCIRGKNCGYS